MTTAILSILLALTAAAVVALIWCVWRHRTHLQQHQRYIEALRIATLVALERHNYEWPPSMKVSSAEYLKSTELWEKSGRATRMLEGLGLPDKRWPES